MYSRIEYCSNCKIGHKIRSLLSKYLQNSYKLEKACHIATSGRPGQVTKFLVFLDRNHQNWSAYVDSGKTEMITANGIFKGLYVPSGQHIIHLQYSDPLMSGAIFLQSFSIIMGLLLLVTLFFRFN